MSSESKLCYICLDDIEQLSESAKIDSCSHIYHQKCLQEWLKKKRSCPICRASAQFSMNRNKDGYYVLSLLESDSEDFRTDDDLSSMSSASEDNDSCCALCNFIIEVDETVYILSCNDNNNYYHLSCLKNYLITNGSQCPHCCENGVVIVKHFYTFEEMWYNEDEKDFKPYVA